MLSGEQSAAADVEMQPLDNTEHIKHPSPFSGSFSEEDAALKRPLDSILQTQIRRELLNDTEGRSEALQYGGFATVRVQSPLELYQF